MSRHELKTFPKEADAGESDEDGGEGGCLLEEETIGLAKDDSCLKAFAH
jgi:hypothetical protein